MPTVDSFYRTSFNGGSVSILHHLNPAATQTTAQFYFSTLFTKTEYQCK